MIDAAYPDYGRVIPRASGNVVICDRAELLASLNRRRITPKTYPPYAARSEQPLTARNSNCDAAHVPCRRSMPQASPH
jgi:hypothetical protein